MKTKINLAGEVRLNEPLALHTTFQTGGPADAMVFPADFSDVEKTVRYSRSANLPLFILGRGANLLVSDRGIRGITLNLTTLTGLALEGDLLTAQAGADVSQAAEFGAERNAGCLEFLYGMPSTVGGAVWMNARCYGSEVADVLEKTLVLTPALELKEIPFRREDWDYKISPFQKDGSLILQAWFRTQNLPREEIRKVMDRNKTDRETKGHFRLPCAGSVFKNNHAFGQPSGVLIDQAGLKGLRRGRAVVSDWHANIIVNEGGASSADIRALVTEVKEKLFHKTGFLLEEEILYAGEW